MLSVISVTGMPSCCNSQAVSRAPCRNGRVSSAKTSILLAGLDRRADDAQRRSVAGGRQRAGVAVRQHGLPSGTSSAPLRPMARQMAMSSSRISRASSIMRAAIASMAAPSHAGIHALHAVDAPRTG